MGKGVANMPRYREVCMAANRRYLEALAVVPAPGKLKEQIQCIGRRTRTGTRSHRALNPASKHDVDLLAAEMRGEHSLQGFRNSNIREHFNEPTTDDLEHRRQSHRTGRLLKLLHAHSLIAKVPRTRRWRVTKHGHAVMSAILTIHHQHYPASNPQVT